MYKDDVIFLMQNNSKVQSKGMLRDSADISRAPVSLPIC